mgnify:CR=1 FL=1
MGRREAVPVQGLVGCGEATAACVSHGGAVMRGWGAAQQWPQQCGVLRAAGADRRAYHVGLARCTASHTPPLNPTHHVSKPHRHSSLTRPSHAPPLPPRRHGCGHPAGRRGRRRRHRGLLRGQHVGPDQPAQHGRHRERAARHAAGHRHQPAPPAAAVQLLGVHSRAVRALRVQHEGGQARCVWGGGQHGQERMGGGRTPRKRLSPCPFHYSSQLGAPRTTQHTSHTPSLPPRPVLPLPPPTHPGPHRL